jgi:hypothetical protein
MNLFGQTKASTRYTVECFAHYHKNGERCPEPWNCGDSHLRVLEWKDGFWNLVVTEGLNELLGRSFDTVPANVNWYGGLIGAGTGTVAITSGAAAVTGTSTSFANGDNGSDIIIVGAGASGADLITTVSGNPASATSLTTAANAGTTVSGAGYAIEPRPADTRASHSFNENTTYSNANRPTWTKNAAPSGGAMSNSSSKMVFSINGTTRIYGAFLISDNTKGGTSAGVLYGGGLFSAGSRAVLSGDSLNVQADLSVTAS